jgi:hypothetical protein
MTTLGNYIHWLCSEGGQSRSGIGADEVVGMVPITKLISPDGSKYVIYSSGDQSEILSSHTIEYFDRRLGVVSPFRSVPRA